MRTMNLACLFLHVYRTFDSWIKNVSTVAFLREEFESEYQDKQAEYEEELREWKKEAKRRVNNTESLIFVLFLTLLPMYVSF